MWRSGSGFRPSSLGHNLMHEPSRRFFQARTGSPVDQRGSRIRGVFLGGGCRSKEITRREELQAMAGRSNVPRRRGSDWEDGVPALVSGCLLDQGDEMIAQATRAMCRDETMDDPRIRRLRSENSRRSTAWRAGISHWAWWVVAPRMNKMTVMTFQRGRIVDPKIEARRPGPDDWHWARHP